jgi:hypothetical protein
LLLAAQRQSWQRGQRTPVEDYLRQQPAIQTDTEAVLDLIYHEVLLREQLGERPQLAEYQQRFPSLATQLQSQFELDRALGLGPTVDFRPSPELSAVAAVSPPTISVSEVVENLVTGQFLEPARVQELTKQLQRQFTQSDSLVRELVQRGWLTSYQADQLVAGRGTDLVIGPYILLEPLGEGGMGQVFKARHRVMKRMVALKLIRRGHQPHGEAVQRFQHEIQALATLSHPNIIVAHDAGRMGDRHFVAMEYVEGTDLGQLLRTHGPLPVAEVCEYARQAALGLQHVHEHGLVHRDIKR